VWADIRRHVSANTWNVFSFEIEKRQTQRDQEIQRQQREELSAKRHFARMNARRNYTLPVVYRRYTPEERPSDAASSFPPLNSDVTPVDVQSTDAANTGHESNGNVNNTTGNVNNTTGNVNNATGKANNSFSNVNNTTGSVNNTTGKSASSTSFKAMLEKQSTRAEEFPSLVPCVMANSHFPEWMALTDVNDNNDAQRWNVNVNDAKIGETESFDNAIADANNVDTKNVDIRNGDTKNGDTKNGSHPENVNSVWNGVAGDNILEISKQGSIGGDEKTAKAKSAPKKKKRPKRIPLSLVPKNE